MHVDSRNPTIYISGLKCTDTHGNKFAFHNLYGYEVTEIGIQNIHHTMYIDYCDMEAYDMQYVKRSDYDTMKAKLENLERKHAKLRRRHDTLGQKYVILNQGFEGLLYRVKVMEDS